MVFRGDRFLRGGDHRPFANQGFAAVRLTSASENYDNQHTITDTFANTSVPYATRVARMNAAVLASLALAPSPPVLNWTWASGPDKGGHVPMLTRGKSGYDAVLHWLPNTEADLAGYAVMVRSTTSPVWEREIWVGNVTSYTMPDVSIDDVVIGVKAVDRDGNQSIVSCYTEPVLPVPDHSGREKVKRGSGPAAGAQKRSKASVNSFAMSAGSRRSMSLRWIMYTGLPSWKRAMEGEDGG